MLPRSGRTLYIFVHLLNRIIELFKSPSRYSHAMKDNFHTPNLQNPLNLIPTDP
jgi:hypothetical protein